MIRVEISRNVESEIKYRYVFVDNVFRYIYKINVQCDKRLFSKGGKFRDKLEPKAN